MSHKSKLVLAHEARVKERAEELRIFIFKKVEKMRRAGRSTGDFNYDGGIVSYEHCDTHDKDATNGCPDCESEDTESRAEEIAKELVKTASEYVSEGLFSELKEVSRNEFVLMALQRAIVTAAFRLATLEKS